MVILVLNFCLSIQRIVLLICAWLAGHFVDTTDI